MKRAADFLSPGDTFTHPASGPDGIRVTALSERQPWTDLFGRELFAYLWRREDTGEEGLMPFGPGGVVRP